MDKPLTYDEALSKHIGQFGPGQWLQVFWASIPQIANAAAFFLWTFITINPVADHSWRCSSPADAACAAMWQQEVPSSSSFCSLSPDQWQWSSQDSVVARFNLVCGDAWKVQFANSLMFVGAFVGSGLFGWACDRWGRRLPLFLATALVAAAVLASLAAPSYWVMAALRAVAGIGAAGQTHTIFLLSTEPVGPDFRGFAATASLMLFTVGEFAIIALAYALPAWQHLLLAVGCLNAATLLLYPIVTESARWLLSQGRTQEATSILRRIADGNSSALPAQALVSGSSSQLSAPAPATPSKTAVNDVEDGSCSTSQSVTASSGAVSAAASSVGLRQLLQDWHLAVRLAVLLLNWFALFMNFYGIALGSGGISGSIYLTFAISVVAEVVALLLVGPTVDRVGRHNIVALGQLLGGAACVACAMVSGGTTQAVLAGVGKFGCSAASATISIYTAELLPTSCRSSVLGICSQVSRLGSLAAPFLLMLGTQLGSVGGYSQVFVPFMVFGCLALLAGLLTLLTLPETSGADMPETIEDLNKLQTVFTAKAWRQGCLPCLAFLFRTKASTAYPPAIDPVPTAPKSSSRRWWPFAASKATLPTAVTALVVAEVRGGQAVACTGQETDVVAAGGTAASPERKASLFDDADLMLKALADEIEAGAVVVTVHVGESCTAGSDANSSNSSTTGSEA